MYDDLDFVEEEATSPVSENSLQKDVAASATPERVVEEAADTFTAALASEHTNASSSKETASAAIVATEAAAAAPGVKQAVETHRNVVSAFDSEHEASESASAKRDASPTALTTSAPEDPKDSEGTPSTIQSSGVPGEQASATQATILPPITPVYIAKYDIKGQLASQLTCAKGTKGSTLECVHCDT